ncbi:hypothetical protein Tco_0514001 [Tanacetum coccineum]
MENEFTTLFALLQTNSKRESIFFTTPEEIRLTKFCQQEVKPILHELHLNFEIFQKQFSEDIKEMKDVFDSTESDLCATCKQNELLNDQLLEAKLKHEIECCVLMSHGCVNNNVLKAASSIRRSSNRDSSFKNSVLSNTKKSSEKLVISDRTNKETYVASKNVVLNKMIVTDVDVKNDFKVKNVLCASCAKNALIPCHDTFLANYKLNVHSKVRRALFTTPRTTKSTFVDTTLIVSKTRFSVKTTQSKSLDTTPVVSKTKIATVTPLSAKNKVSSAFKTITIILRERSLSTYMKNKIRTSRIWQKWYELQPNIGWSPIKMTPNVVNSSNTVNTNGYSNHPLVHMWCLHVLQVVPIVLWIVDSSCSKHMTGDRLLLENFVEKFMGIVRFGNDHFAEITCYGDYVQDDLGKMKPKADIGIFIGYSETSRGFRIYNRRTKKIMETIHVKFDELIVMASEHDSLEPILQRFINDDSSAESMNISFNKIWIICLGQCTKNTLRRDLLRCPSIPLHNKFTIMNTHLRHLQSSLKSKRLLPL